MLQATEMLGVNQLVRSVRFIAAAAKHDRSSRAHPNLPDGVFDGLTRHVFAKMAVQAEKASHAIATAEASGEPPVTRYPSNRADVRLFEVRSPSPGPHPIPSYYRPAGVVAILHGDVWELCCWTRLQDHRKECTCWHNMVVNQLKFGLQDASHRGKFGTTTGEFDDATFSLDVSCVGICHQSKLPASFLQAHCEVWWSLSLVDLTPLNSCI
jgi:hypothetical protein